MSDSNAPRARRGVAVLVGLVCFVQTLVYSIPLPALPQYLLFRDDENLQLTQGQLGVIMGSATAVTVLVQPIVGRLLVSATSEKTMITLGLLINGSFTALMALMELMRSSAELYLFAGICHAVASVGHSMSSVAIYVSLGVHLSDINHVMLPLFDVLFGVAMVVGPIMGGPLYDLAGIAAVYVATGALCFVTTLFVLVLYPAKRSGSTKEKSPRSQATYAILLKFPVVLNIVLIAHCYCMMLYNDVTLTNRLQKVLSDWPAEHSYAVFGIAGASFAVLGVVFGVLAKHVPDTRVFVLLALPIGAASWILISAGLDASAELLSMYVGQFLLGLSMSPMFVCCYFFTLKYLGGAEDPGVYAIVSGAFNPAANLGGAAGQLISEFLRIPSERVWMPPFGTDFAMVVFNVLLTIVLALTMCFDSRLCLYPKHRPCT